MTAPALSAIQRKVERAEVAHARGGPAEVTANERPILFSAPMVRAILAGRKTQTRRPIKPQPVNVVGELKTGGMWLVDTKWHIACPYGKPGDRLWVRETWHGGNGSSGQPAPGYVSYRADGEMMEFFRKKGNRWRSPIHMPRWASRIILEVESVRVERLQDITSDDALAEGVDTNPDSYIATIDGKPAKTVAISAAYAFGYLWDSIHGRGAWKANPWVWVAGFKRVSQ
jgi:hypothetical protein